MNTDDIIKMAIDAHLFDDDQEPYIEHLEQFAALVTQAERESRQAAQAENEQLKARLARSGVELRKAVRDEREACAKVGDKFEKSSQYKTQRNLAQWIAADIRARSIHDCTDCDCADNEPCKRTAPGLALESGEFVPAEKITGWAAA